MRQKEMNKCTHKELHFFYFVLIRSLKKKVSHVTWREKKTNTATCFTNATTLNVLHTKFAVCINQIMSNEMKIINFTYWLPVDPCHPKLVCLYVHHPMIYPVMFFHVMYVRLQILLFLHCHQLNFAVAFVAFYHVPILATTMMKPLLFHRTIAD